MRPTMMASALFGALALTTLWSRDAAAQYDSTASGGGGHSKQDSALELRFGRYDLKINDEFEGESGLQQRVRDTLGSDAGNVFSESELQDLQKTFFGTKPRYHLGLEYDWQLWRLPRTLSLAPALGWSLTQFDSQTFTRDGSVSPQVSSLSVMPMHLVAVLRVDALAERTPIPLVPYAKLGLGTAFWWFDDGVGLPRTADGKAGKGTSSGFVWAAGIMLRLDAFDPASAADLDATYGINHSYAFIEWFDSYLDNFGGDALRVGSASWTAGIALEF